MESEKKDQKVEVQPEEEEKKTDDTTALTEQFEKIKFNEGEGVPIDPELVKTVEG